MKVLVNCGTKCNISEFGYYNFVYPSNRLENILDDIEAEVINWVNFDNKFPIKISSNFISNFRYKTKDMVVWVDKDSVSIIDTKD